MEKEFKIKLRDDDDSELDTPSSITPHHNQGLEFTGKSGEYFRIWLTNNLLILLTLGIYFPWALVRKKKYFYNNMALQGHNFDYTAKPERLLIGYTIYILSQIILFVAFFSLFYST